jgi:hypothetical protein
MGKREIFRRVPAGRRWAYVGTVVGAAVSILANIGHSYVPPERAPADWQPYAGAVAFAIFWPVALLIALEVLARTLWPVKGQPRCGWGVMVRLLGLPPVALVAAVVSYRHMSGLLNWYGEDSITVAIGPLGVDGLMIMSAGALILTRVAVAVEVAEPAPAEPAEPAEPVAPEPEPEPESAPLHLVPPSDPVPAIRRTRRPTQPRRTARPDRSVSEVEAVQRVRGGESQRSVAAALNVSPATVNGWVKRSGEHSERVNGERPTDVNGA